jgi:hypothetical protein
MKNHPHAGRRWAMPLVIAVIVAGYALSLRIFYPGVMTYDAWYVHADIATGFRGDWQSPVMTVLWAAIDPIAPGAASMFLLIATLYWLGFAVLALSIVRRSGGAALAMAVAAFTPPAFVFVGVIWRDMLFATVWLLAAALVFSAAERRDNWRRVAQVVAIALLALGLLLRPNALFAAPILAVYLIWPTRYDLRRAALFFVPAVFAFYALIPTVYYGMLGARHQNVLHSILVFDLGGITHFIKQNQFPVTWTAEQDKLLTESCYQPAAWDYYWTIPPCSFVMARLEGEKIFGSPILVDAWWRAIVAHPIAYVQHRFTVMGQFLFGVNQTMWTVDIAHPDQVVFADNAWFVAAKNVNDVLKPTPLFRAITWLLVCAASCALAWRRRGTPVGAFVIGVAGSACVYVATFLPFGVASDFRYAYWAVLAGLTSAILLASRPGGHAVAELRY